MKSIASTVQGSSPWGMGVLLVFSFLTFSRIGEVLPFLASLKTIFLTGAFAAIAWILAPGSFQEKIPLSIPQVRNVIFLMILGIISIPLSVWPGGSFNAVTQGLWKLVLFFILLFYMCRSMQDMRRIIWTCCLGLSCLLLVALITPGDSHTPGGGRFSAGYMYDSNDLALILAMLIPLLVFLLSHTASPYNLLVLGMIFLCLLGIIFTQSRGGFLALVTVAGLILVRAKFSPPLKFIVAFAIIMVFFIIAGASFWDRMSTIWNPQTEYDLTAGSRTENWKTALTLMATRPWGSGYGVCDIAIGEASGGQAGRWNTAHNSFLQIGVELGVPGFLVFLSLLLGTLKDLRRVQSLSELSQNFAERDLASMLEVSIYGFVVGGFFLSQAYSQLLYLIIGLSLVLSRKVTQDNPSPNVLRPAQIPPWAVRRYGQSTP